MLAIDPFYLQVIGTAALGMVCYIALAYMVSKALGRPQLTAYANVELNQLIISVVILAAALLIWQFSNVFADSIANAPAGTHAVDIAGDFTGLVVNKGIIPIYLRLVKMEVTMSYFNAVEYRMGPGVWNWITKAVPGLDPLISIVRMLIFTFTALYGTLSIQIIIFKLIDAVMYTYILPAGIVLRFFPPTRDAGVYLIVLAIAFQCFFPMLYAVNFMALNDMWTLHGWSNGYDPSADDPSFFSSVNAAAWGTYSAFGYLVSWLPVLVPFNYISMLPLFERIAQISLVGLFLPALAMGLTIAFINAVTKFITGKG